MHQIAPPNESTRDAQQRARLENYEAEVLHKVIHSTGEFPALEKLLKTVPSNDFYRAFYKFVWHEEELK